MNRKIYLITTIIILALIGILGYFHFSHPQAEEEEFTGDFGSENNHYRNTEMLIRWWQFGWDGDVN